MNELFTISNLLIFVLCYIIGSFPTAYLLVKANSNKDLTKEGSGNIGTLNSFTVSKSKTIGISVLLIDLFKGIIPVYLMLYVFNLGFPSAMIGACSLILGHNYPVWLKFKGGRGLATGAGIFIVINYFIIIGWVIVWFSVFAFKRKVLISNTIATFSLPLYVLLVNVVPFMLINNNVTGFSLKYFNIFSLIITAIILLRHTEVFKTKTNTK
jgi:glycerol-3-phosphate acyltransferase PlsY